MKESPNEIEIASVEQFKSFYDLLDDLVFLFDPVSYGLLAANKAFYQVLQLSPESTDWNVRTASTSENNILELQKGIIIETSFSIKANDKLPVQLQAFPADFKNAKVLLGVAKDLSKLKEIEDKLKSAEKEKNTLLNEVYHRVKNNLNIIVSLLSLQINRIDEPVVRHLLMESKSRVFTLALLQQKLHGSARVSEIKVSDYLSFLGYRIISSFKSSVKNIKLMPAIDNCWLDVDTLVPLGLITNELLTNAVIHAFPLQNEGEIRMLLNKDKEDQFIFQIKDNGIGLPYGEDINAYNQTLGFQLVQSLARQLKAQISVRSSRNQGVDISFRFNLSTYECT